MLKDKGGKEKTQCADSVQFVSYFPGPPHPTPTPLCAGCLHPASSSHLCLQWTVKFVWVKYLLPINLFLVFNISPPARYFVFFSLSFFFFSAELRGLTRVGLYALITVANDAPPLYNTGLRCQINVKMPPCMFHYQGQQRRGAAAPALDVCIMTSFSVCFLWKTQSFNYNFKDSLHCQDTEAHQCPVFPW